MLHTTRFLTRAAVLGALVAGATAARAQFTLSELLVNPPGTDDGQEGVEIRGPASTALTGWFLIAIDGDGTSAGIVDVAQDLSTYSTGTNGLLLIRDGVAVISPAPEVATTVVVFNWNPDIENGSNTYVLGFGTPPATTTDLDTNDDGTLDVLLAGFTVVDSVTIIEQDAGVNVGYADDLGGTLLPQFATFTADGLYRIYNANGTPCNWAGGDVLGTNPGGPYTWDVGPGEVFGGVTGGGHDLGTANIILDADLDGTADACDVPTVSEAFCFGDGLLADHTTPCPCTNDGAPGNGCANSTNPNGANLTTTGTAAGDDVVLVGSGMPAVVSCIYLQGDALDDIVFGDGVRCAGGNLIRLRTKANVGGASSFPDSADTITLSARGGVTPGSGARRYYQTYYRNSAAAFCPPETFNVTNGWKLDW